MLTRSLLLATCLVASLFVSAEAQAPREIPYQGTLADGGVPVTSATPVVFRLHDAATGGEIVWAESQTVTPGADGRFTARLGSVADLPVSFDQPLWLSVTADGTALGPRTPLGAAPHALALYGIRVQPSEFTGYGPSILASHPSNQAGQGAVVAGGGFDDGTTAQPNRAFGTSSVVSGGVGNTADNTYATVGGGASNVARLRATVGGGEGNTASGRGSTVGGGEGNTASGRGSTVGGGEANSASGSNSAVGGGEDNTTSDGWATIGGGNGNTVASRYATVGGGQANTAGLTESFDGRWATVGGGRGNTASQDWSTVGGGNGNTASHDWSTVGGGKGNTASGVYSTVPGGEDNRAEGAYAFAAGKSAVAAHDGAFVWSSRSSFTGFSSTGPNQFLIDAEGGVGVGTNAPTAQLHVETADRRAGVFLNDGSSGLNTATVFAENSATVNGTVGWFEGNGSGQVVVANQNGSGDLYRGIQSGNLRFRVQANGDVLADGTFTGGGADLAEFFPLADGAAVAPGEVVGLRGGQVSLRTEGAEQIAVISSDPAFIGNPDAEAGGALVALVGQVAVDVSGDASPGDLLIASGSADGRARAVAPSAYVPTDGAVLGRVLTADADSVIALVGVDEAAALRGVVQRQAEQIDALTERLARLERLLTP